MTKPGIVFGFLTRGQNEGQDVYRFGKTTKTKLEMRYEEVDRQWMFLLDMFSGLNKPTRNKIVLFEQTRDVSRAWDIVREWLRDRAPRWRQEIKIHQETGFGDNFFSVSCSTEEFGKHLEDLRTKIHN